VIAVTWGRKYKNGDLIFMKSPKDFKVLLVYPNLTMLLVPSLAIALFTGALKKAGYQVGLFDTTHYIWGPTSLDTRRENLQHRPFDTEKDLGVSLKTDIIGDFIKKVDEFQPDLLIVSAVEDTFLQAVELLDAVKEANIPNILGGVFATMAPEVALSYPQVQMIGVGEGEETIIEVSERIRRGESCDDVKNVRFKRPDGTIVSNPLRPLVDIDKPIPDFSLYDEARFYRPMGGRIFKTFPLETYRGCPYSCTFCNSPVQSSFNWQNDLGAFVRRKRIDVVRDEIAELIETYSPEYFYIIDDSFLARPEQEVYEFTEMYGEFGIPFWFNTRPEGTSAKRLAALKAVGADRISYGLECGNEDYRRNVIKRSPTNDEILRSFETISDGGITFSVNNIIGFPGETREMIFETIELNRQIRGFDSLSVGIFTPYHGTGLRQLSIDKGYLDPSLITKHTVSSSLLTQPHITPEEIDGILKTFMLYVRFPKEDWSDIKIAEGQTGEADEKFKEFQERYRATYLSGIQTSPEDWEDPTKYVKAPQAEEPTADVAWGFNCGVEQTEYVMPPNGGNDN